MDRMEPLTVNLPGCETVSIPVRNIKTNQNKPNKFIFWFHEKAIQKTTGTN
jgi:hypothetical protein